MAEPERLHSAVPSGGIFALTNNHTLAVSFSYVQIPDPIPDPFRVRIFGEATLDGVAVMGTEIGIHRAEPVPDNDGYLTEPCALLDSAICHYSAGSALLAMEICRRWLADGGSDDWMWRLLEGRYRLAQQLV